MANFICLYEEADGTRDEFRVVANSLSDAEEKAMEQIAEDHGFEAQFVSIAKA